MVKTELASFIHLQNIVTYFVAPLGRWTAAGPLHRWINAVQGSFRARRNCARRARGRGGAGGSGAPL